MAGTSISFDIIARDMASAKLGRIGAAAERTSGPLGRLGKSLGSMAKTYGPLAAAAAGAFAVKVGIDSVNAASDLNETLTKSQVLFGSSAAAIEDWGETAALRLGQSKREAIDAASTFAIFGKSANLSGKELTGFSTGLAELASDMASFSNTSPEEAITAIGAALRGEQEPIRRFGVLLDDATLRAQAMKMGLIETTTQALTPQQKVLAAHAQILKQTTDAQGDFARTSSGLANQQRILAAQFEDVKAELGQKLLPVAVEFTTWLNSDGIPLVRQFGDEMKDLKFVADAFSDAMRDAGPLLDLFSSNAEDASDASKLLSAAFATIKGPLAATSFALRWMGKSLGLVGEAGRALWNNALAPAFRFISNGVATLADGFAALFRGMSKVPGFGWAKDAANAMENAAEKARSLAAGIRDIPREWSTNYELRTHYSYTGTPPSTKGGPIDPAGRSIGGSSGRSITGSSPRSLSGTSGRAATVEDLAAMLSAGLRITLVDGDAGRRAIMAAPGAI